MKALGSHIDKQFDQNRDKVSDIVGRNKNIILYLNGQSITETSKSEALSSLSDTQET